MSASGSIRPKEEMDNERSESQQFGTYKLSHVYRAIAVNVPQLKHLFNLPVKNS